MKSMKKQRFNKNKNKNKKQDDKRRNAKMTKYKIIYDQKSCIGAGECEAISKALWKVNNKGKAELTGAKLNEATGKYELEIDEDQVKEQNLVVGSCPVGCIKIEKTD